MPAGMVVVDRGGWERGAQLSAFTQGTFSRGRYNIIHAEIIFHRPYAISAGSFIFKLRQSSCFSDLWISARRIGPDRAVVFRTYDFMLVGLYPAGQLFFRLTDFCS